MTAARSPLSSRVNEAPIVSKLDEQVGLAPGMTYPFPLSRDFVTSAVKFP